MALKDMSLVTAPTSLDVTGGSALVFADDGVTINNGLHLIVPSDSDYQTRRTLTAKFRPPAINPATGSYGKDKKSMTYVLPQVLSDGSVVFNTLRIEREVHPSLPAADALDMINVGAQMLFDADTADFWANGSVS